MFHATIMMMIIVFFTGSLVSGMREYFDNTLVEHIVQNSLSRILCFWVRYLVNNLYKPSYLFLFLLVSYCLRTISLSFLKRSETTDANLRGNSNGS